MSRWHAAVWNGQAIGIGDSADAAKADALLACGEMDDPPHIDDVKLVPIDDELAVKIQNGLTEMERLGPVWMGLIEAAVVLDNRIDALLRAAHARSRDAAVGELRAIEALVQKQLERFWARPGEWTADDR